VKILVMDLDGTICIDDSSVDYSDKKPREDVVTLIKKYKVDGFKIVISTARNMRTYNGNIQLININTLPIIISWLEKHNIPYDEILVGKPWCGNDGFYVDDKAIRPSEFINNSYEDILKILNHEASISKD